MSSFGRSGCILYSNEGKIKEEDFRIEPAFKVDENGVLRIGKFILKEPTIYMMEKNSVAFPRKSVSFEDTGVLISKEDLKGVFSTIIEDAVGKNEKNNKKPDNSQIDVKNGGKNLTSDNNNANKLFNKK